MRPRSAAIAASNCSPTARASSRSAGSRRDAGASRCPERRRSSMNWTSRKRIRASPAWARSPRRTRGKWREEVDDDLVARRRAGGLRSEEHTSELQSLMRLSYAVFCLKKKIHTSIVTTYNEMNHSYHLILLLHNVNKV